MYRGLLLAAAVQVSGSAPNTAADVKKTAAVDDRNLDLVNGLIEDRDDERRIAVVVSMQQNTKRLVSFAIASCFWIFLGV